MPAGPFPASSSVGAESTVSLFYKEAELHIAASPFSRIRHFWFKEESGLQEGALRGAY